MTSDEQIFLSVSDAARHLGIGRSALYQHFLQPGRLPTARVGKRVLIHREDLEHLADELRAEATERAVEGVAAPAGNQDCSIS